ncbi:potassium-transporting ATPase subunit KdpA [Streptomyces noursei]|nr:potassium-transporting ATPase subunit KdpA [Streptomyces noursei]MCZ1013031.1 potassium-transporting ATPase subunit KdpA [Streptomyces noursei]GGX43203.1 hypothetical protein GCM10010341_76500 [Streptomyces noursei]
MADLAFVVTTIAVFALVALVAKGLLIVTGLTFFPALALGPLAEGLTS